MSFKRRASTEIEKPPLKTELENFIARWQIVQSGLSNLADSSTRKQVSRAIREMEVLSRKIDVEIAQSEPPEDLEDVVNDFRQVNAFFQDKKAQIRTAIDESETRDMMKTAAAATRQDPLMQSILVDDEQAQLDMVQGAAKEVVSQMQELNATTHKLNNMIQEQHTVVVKIDETIKDAKDEMIAGNADLSDAEEYQKQGGKCLYWILGGVGTLAILVMVAVWGYLWVFKK